MILISCGKEGTHEQKENNTGSQESHYRTITDMAGRKVTIPEEIDSVYATHTIGTLFVYTLNPELVAGWNFALQDAEKEFIKEQYYNLPILGRWKGTGSSNTEEIILAHPDIIINMGDLTENFITESDEMQQLLGIPVVMIDGTLTNQDKAYEFAGDLLNLENRSASLAEYSRTVLNHMVSKASTLSDQEKISVYYGAGMDGLETIPKGSINTETLSLVGGLNIADPGMEKNLRRMNVSIEQLLTWNPPFIILSTLSSNNKQLFESIQENEKWEGIKAVADNHVFEIPYGPYDWFSQPPTILRILGVQWLGNLLYPDLYNLDIEEEIKNFYSLFFSLDLSDAQVGELISHSIRADY